MLPHRNQISIIDILNFDGVINFITNNCTLPSLMYIFAKRKKIVQNLRMLYFKTICLEKSFKYSWYVDRIKGNHEYDYRTKKALVDSIIAMSHFDTKGFAEGFKLFAPLFKEVYPEGWEKIFGKKPVLWCKFDDKPIFI